MLGAGDCLGLMMTRRIATGLPGFRRCALREPAIVARPIYLPPGMHWWALRDLWAKFIAHARSEPRLMETYA